MVDTWSTLFLALFVGGLVYALTLLVMLYSSQAFIAWLAPGILHVFDQKFLRTHGLKVRPVANTIYSGESE